MPVRVRSLMCCTGIISLCVGKNSRPNLMFKILKILKKSFCNSGAVLFNSLPQDIRKCQSLPQFKKEINKYYDNVI